MIFAHGSRFGGHALFIKDTQLHYVYNFLGIKPEQKFVSSRLSPGKYALGVEFDREKAGQHGESMGTTQLYVDDRWWPKVRCAPRSARSPCAATACASASTALTPSVGSTHLATTATLSTAGLLSALPSTSALYRISTWGEKRPRRLLEISASS